jgi:hypothetical protein
MTLHARVSRGLFWEGGAALIGQGMGFLVSLLLARLLTPEYFGLIGIATLAIQSLVFFQELGFSAALIYRQDDVEAAGQHRALDHPGHQHAALRRGLSLVAAGSAVLPQPRGDAGVAGAGADHRHQQLQPRALHPAGQGAGLSQEGAAGGGFQHGGQPGPRCCWPGSAGRCGRWWPAS